MAKLIFSEIIGFRKMFVCPSCDRNKNRWPCLYNYSNFLYQLIAFYKNWLIKQNWDFVLNLPWHCPLFWWQLQLFHAQQQHIILEQNPNRNLPNEHRQMEKSHKILFQCLHHPHLSNLFKLVAENFNAGILNPNFLSQIF